MTITADYHLHTHNSGDSTAPMEDMIKKGISLGLTTMCFTEHMDMDYVYGKPEEAGMFELNTDSYLYELATLKEKYENQIQILFGVELGIQPHLQKELNRYSRSYPFDFIIASSHICHGRDPYYPSFYEGRSDEEAYREYFSSILENLDVFSNFDVYGHLDYVVRYGASRDKDYCYEKYQDIFDKILIRLLEMERGIELNTAGLRKGMKDVHPCTGVLKRYKQLGGEIITIGSDAHNPSAIAGDFDRAADVLRECGFSYYTTFENRIADFHCL